METFTKIPLVPGRVFREFGKIIKGIRDINITIKGIGDTDTCTLDGYKGFFSISTQQYTNSNTLRNIKIHICQHLGNIFPGTQNDMRYWEPLSSASELIYTECL